MAEPKEQYKCVGLTPLKTELRIFMSLFKKQIQTFMTTRDEDDFSSLLKTNHPQIEFIDGNLWSSSEPPLITSISKASGNYVYIWSRGVLNPLPSLKRPDGKVEGPSSGCVLQFTRTIENEGTLRSGRLAAGCTRESPYFTKLKMLVHVIFRALDEIVTKEIVQVHPHTKAILNHNVSAYVVGKAAIEWCKEDSNRLLKDRSTEVYFYPNILAVKE
jgi:hypothetical protein